MPLLNRSIKSQPAMYYGYCAVSIVLEASIEVVTLLVWVPRSLCYDSTAHVFDFPQTGSMSKK